MGNCVRDINELKQQVKQLIVENNHKEVTLQTKYKSSGIYMIYIDNFTDDKVVPIYIGQSIDIQRRYKQHYSEILALNRLTYDEYERYFFSKGSSFYEGSLKSCKIFKYMIENKCTLKDFHMVILDEIEIDKLEEKEQEYFRRLLSSFFGFNQFNSFLKSLPFRFSNIQMNEKEINDYLDLFKEDIQGIHDYYNYGFTKFNFEHSMPTPRDIDYLLKGKGQWRKETLFKFEKVKSDLYDQNKKYKPDYDEMRPFLDKKDKLYGDYVVARFEFNRALDAFKSDINKEFRKQKLYSEKAKDNFINSVIHEDNSKHKEQFQDYIKSRKCEIDLYRTFQNHIDKVQNNYEIKNNKNKPYQEIANKILDWEVQNRSERYKMIFPACQFEPFALGDNIKDLPMKISMDDDLFNTCHINIYISNNALSRSYIRKDPDILRIDYCYINDEGKKYEKQYYIENETTKNCSYGIGYYEQDFYSMFAFRPEKFKITSLIDDEQDNSFISILAEYKHGINDYTIKDKELVQLTAVFNEIHHLINDETRFEVEVSESYPCLGKCLNEDLHNNPFVKRLLSRKLPKISKGRKSKSTSKKVVVQNNKSLKTRAEKYQEKIKVRSNNKITTFNYISSKEKVLAKCNNCSYEWEKRSDHLLARPFCPLCEKSQ
ncbi:excinuclease ABC subunit C [Sporosarcina sp. Marseille-Q4063]|uniref:GIY-YIG nuclease family protein n=1 Tax=Sporosarcina sp. Marseille-Q4063 TaxID=2810514 RepID=UPI001BAEBA24|nr:GIY-YIG nuclease family protein [Sporosarcina sp. Marseille-Q4063]QUW23612.1 excinuclease ABC subunit C [Sporosarcina sp. Marseille-Q4063]